MANIPVYQQQVSAQGDLKPQVDYGAERTLSQGISRGLGALARGLGDVSQAQQMIESDQARTWASTAAAQAELGLRQKVNDHINSLDPTSKDYPEQIANVTSWASDQFESAQDDLLAQAPSNDARRLLAEHMNSAKVPLLSGVMNAQARLNASYSTSVVQQGVDANTKLLAADPSDGNLARIEAQDQKTIGSLSTVSPEVKQKWLDENRALYSKVQVATVASQNPYLFLKSIDPNAGYDDKNGQPHSPLVIANYGADTVKPFSPQKVQDVQAMVSAPSPYDAYFQAAGAKYGVDPQELKMRAAVESGLDPKASNGQAAGIMQFTPATAKSLGIDPLNPEQAIDAAAQQIAKYKKADPSNVDQMYYGGADRSKWGPNTEQYAANLNAVRQTLSGGTDPQVKPLSLQQIASADPGIAGWKALDLQDRVQIVRKAEAQIGKGLSTERSSMSSEIQDAMASFQSGQDYPGITSPRFSQANLERLYGTDKGGRLHDELQYGRAVGGFVGQVATMPVDQMQQTIAQLKPTPGVNFAEEDRIYRAAVTAAAQVQKQRTATPVKFAIQHGIQDAQPLDFSNLQNLEAGLKNRVAAMYTMHGSYGAPLKMFDKGETGRLVAALKGMPGAEAVRLLGTMRAGMDDDNAYSVAMSQLAPHDRVIAYAGELASKDGSAYVGDTAVNPSDVAATVLDGERILDGRAFGKPKEGDQMGTVPSGSKAFKFDDGSFRLEFNNEMGNAFQSPDAQMGASQQTEMYQAAKAYYVAQAYKSGDDLSVIQPDKVKSAVEAVVGSTWKTGGSTLIAPYGMKLDTFQGQWPSRATQALQQDGFSADDARRILNGNPIAQQKTMPINLGDGRYGFQVGTGLLVGPNGRKVVIDFHQPFEGTMTPLETNNAMGAGARAGLPMLGMK